MTNKIAIFMNEKRQYRTVVVENPPKYCKNKHMVFLYDEKGKKIEAGIFYMNFDLTRSQKKLFKDIFSIQ